MNQNDAGTVTLELSSILVRLHGEPTTWGDCAPYDASFLLVQVGAKVMEAKGAAFLDLPPSKRRELGARLAALGIEEVFYWRYKKNRAPYKYVIRVGKSEVIK